MIEADNPTKEREATQGFQAQGEEGNRTSTPSQQQIPKNDKQGAFGFLGKWIARPILAVVHWLDDHDGALTALATIAIAYLTYSLAEDSKRQADSVNGQLTAMQAQLNEMKTASGLTRDQLTLAYPPQIRVTNVDIWHKGTRQKELPTMKPGEEISGTAYAINYGRERATINASLIEPDWEDHLPMLRPYSGKTPRPDQELFNETGTPIKELAPGEFGQWSFSAQVPKDYDGKKSLYVMGFVIFYDRLNTHHTVLFARKYDPATQTFSKVDNPDYEGDE